MLKFGNWLKTNRWALLPTFPLILLWLFWACKPTYWFTADPAAQYFLDSLAIFAGKPYLYVDHPGTPLHLIGSLLMGLTYPFFGSPQKLIHYFITEPETFFFMANLFMLAMNLVTVVWFFQTASGNLKKDARLAGIAISLTYFAIHPQGFNSLTYWSHNSFNFIFGTLWLLWLFRETQQATPISKKKLFLLGLTAGALSMTQLYLLTWLAGGAATIFFLGIFKDKSLRQAFANALVFSFSGIAGIAALLLPALKALPNFIAWITRLVGNQGLYGAGEPGLYNLELIPLSLGFWAQYAPVLMTTLAFALILIGGTAWAAKKARLPFSPADKALLFGLLIQTLLLMLILSKMFYRLRYALSLAALLPVLLLLALKLTEHVNWNLTWLKRTFYAGLIVSALVFMSQEMLSQSKKSAEEREAAVARSQVVTIVAKQHHVDEKDLSVVYAWGTPLKCAGLIMANNWIHAFDREIGDLCPNQYALYDFAYEVKLNLPRPVPTIEQIHWDIVVWPGNGSNLPDYLKAVGAKTIPNSWGVIRSKWFYLAPDSLP